MRGFRVPNDSTSCMVERSQAATLNVNALESQLPRTRRCPQVLPQWKFASREGHTIRSKPSTEMRHSSPETRGIFHYYHWEVLELESKNMQERCELDNQGCGSYPFAVQPDPSFFEPNTTCDSFCKIPRALAS